MKYTREEALNRLLESYRAYYNITMAEEGRKPLAAVCEFFEHSEKYVVSRQAKLWAANCEEFVYLYEVEHLTREIFEQCRHEVWEDGLQRAHIGPGHMYTYVTPIFLCDTCGEDARKALRKCRIYKSFRFSLHGWMDFHTAVLEVLNDNRITTNGSGKCVGKVLKKVLQLNKEGSTTIPKRKRRKSL